MKKYTMEFTREEILCLFGNLEVDKETFIEMDEYEKHCGNENGFKFAQVSLRLLERFGKKLEEIDNE